MDVRCCFSIFRYFSGCYPSERERQRETEVKRKIEKDKKVIVK